MSDVDFVTNYFALLIEKATLSGEILDNVLRSKERWLASQELGGKVIFLGNGGSAGIASHLAIDLAKNGGVRATTFSDAGVITCLANDYGFEEWMRHAIRIYADPGDTLVAISSSGNSKNILNAVDQAKSMNVSVITCSGMAPENPLRQLGEINFWLDSRAYNIVETIHQFWMMAVIDAIIGETVYSANRIVERR